MHLGPSDEGRHRSPALASRRIFTGTVRPESILVGQEARALANQFEGTVTEVLFLGHEREILIDAGGQAFTVRLPASRRITVGEEVLFGWDPQDFLVIEGDFASLEESTNE